MNITFYHRTIILFLTLLLISSCSIKTVYNNLDWVLAGMVSDYVDLTSEQEADVEKRIKALLKWHKKTQLTIYADDLRKIKRYTAEGLNDTRAEEIFTTFLGDWHTVRDRVAPHMVDLFLTLSPEQRKDLYERFEEQNKEFDEEFNETSDAEKIKKGQENLQENFERWLGDLNESQIALLKTWPAKFKAVHPERMQFRKKWQAALRSVLEGNGSKPEKHQRLLALINKPETFQSENHKQLLVYNSKQVKQLVLTFDPTVTTQQKKHLAEKLDYFIQNLDELAAEASRKPE